ncbi:papain family cysteine protease, partial [Teladorsagia circumcincta]
MNTRPKLSKAMVDALRAQKIPLEAQKLTGAPLVEYLKKNQKLFQVDPTPAVDRYKRMVMDLKYSKEKPKAKLTVVKDENDDGGDIPDSFDGRSQWGWMCPSLWYIRDQSLCGSCWALSSAAAMSDRLCIATNGAVQVELSGDDILSCCKDCGKGCDGGWPLYAFDYFSFTGTVTGGNYGTQDCCRPYEIPPCGYHAGEPYYDCNAMYKGTPACVKECQPGYYKTYPMDKYY